MAIDPNKKFLYINRDTTIGEMDEALCFPVSSFIGAETQTSAIIDLYFKGSKGTDATVVRIVHESHGIIKTFYKNLVDEINFGENAFINIYDHGRRHTFPSDISYNVSTDVQPTFTLEDTDFIVGGDNLTFDSVQLTGIQTSGESFSNDDVSLMTSAAIEDKILSYGYSTTSGDMTGVTISVGSGLDISESNTTGGDYSATINLDLTEVGVSGSANQILTDDGDGTVTSESTFTYDSSAGLSITSGNGALTWDQEILTLEHNGTNDPGLKIKSTSGSAHIGGVLQFITDEGAAGASGDILGRIEFVGDNADQDTPQQTYAKIQGKVDVATDGEESGILELQVANHDDDLGTGLTLTGGSQNDEIDVTIGLGTDSLTTIVGDMQVSGGTVNITSETSAYPVINITNSHTDAVGSQLNFKKTATGADGDDLGSIIFIGDDDGDSATVFSRIKSEIETAANTDEAGKLSLNIRCSDGSTSAEQQGLTATGHGTNNTVNIGLGYGAASTTTVAGDLDIDGDKITTAGNIEIETGGSGDIVLDAAGDITLETANGLFSCDAAAVDFNGATAGRPSFNLINNSNDASGPTLSLKNMRDGNGLEDDDVLGSIEFTGEDAAGAHETYGTIVGSVAEADNADEAGQIVISVANDGTLRSGISMTGDKGTAGEIDVTIANGAASTTTIAGNLNVNGTDHAFTSSTDAKPVVTLSSGGTSQVGAQLTFKRTATGVDNTDIGTIHFEGKNDADEDITYARINVDTADASDGAEEGEMVFSVASHDGELQPGLTIVSGDAEDEVDATIGNGSTSRTTVAGDLYINTGLILDSVDVTTIQTSGESFADNDTSLMTSAAIDDRINAAGGGGGGSSKVHMSILNPISYLMYLFNDDSWYSVGTVTSAILGSSSAPSDISSANSELAARIALYTAQAACTVNKLTFNWYWNSSVLSGAKAFEFAFSKFTPITNGSAATITMNSITATDCNDNYTEFLGYQKTFTFSGGNATLAAGDAIAMHMRTTDGSSSQRVLVYGTITLEAELS